MTRDLSHEEARRSKRGKLPVERNRIDGARMKIKKGGDEMKRALGKVTGEEEGMYHDDNDGVDESGL